MTPTVAAMSSSQKLLVKAKTTPAKIIKQRADEKRAAPADAVSSRRQRE